MNGWLMVVSATIVGCSSGGDASAIPCHAGRRRLAFALSNVFLLPQLRSNFYDRGPGGRDVVAAAVATLDRSHTDACVQV